MRRRAFSQILVEGGTARVEREVASVSDVFAFRGDASMRELEKSYLC
jgi:hypothetical protein